MTIVYVRAEWRLEPQVELPTFEQCAVELIGSWSQARSWRNTWHARAARQFGDMEL